MIRPTLTLVKPPRLSPFAWAARHDRLSCVLGFVFLVALMMSAACKKTDSTPTAPTPTPADPTVTETFRGTLAVGGSRFYSFNSSAYGTVNLTLTSLDGQTEPTDTTIGIGVGIPRGTDCTTSNTAIASAGSSPQLTGVFVSGVLCARVYDTGSLGAPVPFVLTIAHP